VAGVTLLIVSVWLRKNGRPYVYTLVPMIFVGLATVFAMLGVVRGYFAAFSEQWLLAMLGSLILALDLWVVGEGMRVLLADRAARPATS
jgi:carbon starvation protein